MRQGTIINKYFWNSCIACSTVRKKSLIVRTVTLPYIQSALETNRRVDWSKLKCSHHRNIAEATVDKFAELKLMRVKWNENKTAVDELL